MIKKSIFHTSATSLSLLLLLSCSTTPSPLPQVSGDKKVKNIIFLIGDGMGPQQLALLELYTQYAHGAKYRHSAMDRLRRSGVTTLMQQRPAQNLVIDSACSATQMATGVEALSEVIGLGPDGKSAETILEKAVKMGKSTGLVSDTRLTHATPASFAAHVPHRSMENEIAMQMIHSKANILFSGGLRHFIPQSQKGSKRKDDINLLDQAKKLGYDVALNKSQMQKSDSTHILGLFTSSGMPDGIENTQTENLSTRQIPTLTEMTLKALEVLEKNPEGFFLMVEGGQIDWASHANDAGWLLHEMLKFDKTVKVVMDWAKNRDDTLIVLTADHETGSFGLSYHPHNPPKAQDVPADDGQKMHYAPGFNFGRYNQLDLLYRQKMPLKDIMEKFTAQNKSQQTVPNFITWVKEQTSITLSDQEAKEALAVEKNQIYDANNSDRNQKIWSKIADFDSYYVYGDYRSSATLSRQLSIYQNTVWGTGTHTSTLIPVTSWGPESIIHGALSKPLTGAKLGLTLIKLID